MSCKYAAVAATLAEDELAKIAGLSASAAAKLLGVGATTIKSHRRRECLCETGSRKIVASVAKNLKVLTLDIENRPNVVHTWGLFNQNIGINQVIQPAGTFGVAYKWYHESKPAFLSDFHDGHEEMVLKTHQLMSEADIICTYNGVSFDLPHLQREFVLMGLPLPKPSAQVDLLKVVRKQFRFTSNKLDFVAQQFGLGSKTSHEGHSLWIRCLNDDPDAWATMKKYAMQDVALTEKLYDRLRGYIPNHPHLGQWSGKPWSCPNCGHADISKHRTGTAHTNVQRYRAYECPKCGVHIRGNKKLLDPTETRVSR